MKQQLNQSDGPAGLS